MAAPTGSDPRPETRPNPRELWGSDRRLTRRRSSPILAAVLSLALARTAAALPPWTATTTAPRLQGLALYYNPGIMATVATNRGYIDHPAEYDDWLHRQGLAGTVALTLTGDLGRRVWIDGPHGLEGPFLVIDCSQRTHYARRLQLGRVIDVDHATATRWAMRGPIPVTVYLDRPPKNDRTVTAWGNPELAGLEAHAPK